MLLVSAVLSLLDLTAQQPSRPQPPDSPYGGPQLKDPSILAGLWEGSNGHGVIVGIQILLNTSGEDVKSIELGLFERVGPELGELPFNYFAPQWRGNNCCRWDGHHLVIDFASLPNHGKGIPDPPVDVDLVWDEAAGTWTGLFKYKSSPGQVVLRRPTAAVPNTTNPLIGTWVSRGGPGDACLHIVQEHDGELNGWVDSIPAPERIIFPRNVPRPQMMGHYGDMTKVALTADGQVAVTFGAYSGICCSRTFQGKLSADGARLEGGYLSGMNQIAMLVVWSRVAGESCGAENVKALAP